MQSTPPPPHLFWNLGMLGLLAIAVTVLVTIYVFSRKRHLDNGPRKGEAADPGKVARQNPPDH
jgi:hypothetical protein